MKVIEIKNITRKDIPIYYRRDFTGTAVLEILEKKLETRIEFSIETKPTGAKDISIAGLIGVDYPLIPLTKTLQEAILQLDKSGALPG
ncbi:MAG: hypothetical protein WCT14_10920 [Treponemataceae bacterium]|jgi:hypothetical protein